MPEPPKKKEAPKTQKTATYRYPNGSTAKGSKISYYTTAT